MLKSVCFLLLAIIGVSIAGLLYRPAFLPLLEFGNKYPLFGSIIEAMLTAAAIIGAALIAKHEITATRKQFQLSAYEDFLKSTRDLIARQADTETGSLHLLEHFKMQMISKNHDERLLYVNILLQIKMYESMYYWYGEGLLPDGLWEPWEKSTSTSFQTPIFKRLWENSRIKHYLRQDFVKYVEGDLQKAMQSL